MLNIMLSQIYFTLTSDSEAILNDTIAFFCGPNRTTERVVNLNVMWLDFVFVLISFIHMHCAVPEIAYVFKL